MAHDLWADNWHPLDAPWGKLDAAKVALLQARMRQQWAPATVRRMMAALRGIITELWRQGDLTADQRDRLLDTAPVRGSNPPAGRSLTPEEIRALYRVATPADRALLAGMLWAGLRRAEMTTVAVGHHGPVSVRLRVTGKGGKNRLVWIHGQPAEDFQPTTLSASGIWKAMARLATRAGVRRFSPHDLRRTYASLSLAQGVDLAMVQRAMGHADPRTTARYDRRPDEAQAAAADGLAALASTMYDGGQNDSCPR